MQTPKNLIETASDAKLGEVIATRPRYTEATEAKRGLPTETRSETNRIRLSVISSDKSTGQAPLTNIKQKSIDAVVGDLTDHSVELRLHLPNGREEVIALPPGLIPIELRRYGTPVSISLNSSDGTRRPFVTQRSIVPAPLERASEIEEWLSSI